MNLLHVSFSQSISMSCVIQILIWCQKLPIIIDTLRVLWLFILSLLIILVLEVLLNLYSYKSFLSLCFTFLVIRIIIGLVVLKKEFVVCITIRKITTFPIWNYPPLLSKIIFCSFLFIFS